MMTSDMDSRRDSKLEFPEIQIVPSKKLETEATENRSTGGFGSRPQMVGDAKKKFGKLAMKVITKIVTEEEKAPPPVARKSLEVPKQRRQSRAVKKGSLTPRSGGLSPTPSHGRSPGGSLMDFLTASAPDVGGKRQSNQFASLIRLAKFRRMTNAFGKGSSASSRRTSIVDIEEDGELPNMPRFCATLSPEAQYSMMKGYEDVLLEQIREARSEYSNLLYRVKTPHQTVLALHIAESAGANNDASETRSHLTVSRPVSREEGSSRFLPRTLTTLHRERNLPSLHYSRDHTVPKLGGKKYEPSESQVKRVTVPKEKQKKLSIKFQRAMDILDTLREERGEAVTSRHRVKKVTNPIAHYNSWSQAWAREFQFEYPAVKH